MVSFSFLSYLGRIGRRPSFALPPENANLQCFRAAVFFFFPYTKTVVFDTSRKTKPCIFIQGLRFK